MERPHAYRYIVLARFKISFFKIPPSVSRRVFSFCIHRWSGFLFFGDHIFSLYL